MCVYHMSLENTQENTHGRVLFKSAALLGPYFNLNIFLGVFRVFQSRAFKITSESLISSLILSSWWCESSNVYIWLIFKNVICYFETTPYHERWFSIFLKKYHKTPKKQVLDSTETLLKPNILNTFSIKNILRHWNLEQVLVQINAF